MAKWVKMVVNAFSLCISTLDYLFLSASAAIVETPDSPVALSFSFFEETFLLCLWCLGGKPSLLSAVPSEVIEGRSALLF